MAYDKYSNTKPALGGNDRLDLANPGGVPSFSLANARVAKPGFFKKGGMGRTLLGYGLGSVGDKLAGNTRFADQMTLLEKQQIDREELMAKSSLEIQKAIALERAKQQMYKPDLAQQADYYRGIGRHDIADDLEAKQRMVTQNQWDPNTGEMVTNYVRPSTQMSGPTESAILYLEQNPETAETFERHYNLPPGSAQRIIAARARGY